MRTPPTFPTLPSRRRHWRGSHSPNPSRGVSRPPEAVAAAVSPFCPSHPVGTQKPCRPFGVAYKLWQESERAKSPSVSTMLVLADRHRSARSACDPGFHRVLVDGSCARCDIRPWELEAQEGGGSAVRSATAVVKPPKPSEAHPSIRSRQPWHRSYPACPETTTTPTAPSAHERKQHEPVSASPSPKSRPTSPMATTIRNRRYTSPSCGASSTPPARAPAVPT